MDNRVEVRCPRADCGASFSLPPERLGRNVRCASCGRPLTARPVTVDQALRRQERSIRAVASSRPVPGGLAEPPPLVALVDNVRSLWNVGSIFRTADACGVARLWLTGITGCPPRAEITKTALGAERSVPWTYHADAGEALACVLDEGYVPVALETTGAGVSLHELDWPARACLIVGNEVAGVTPALLERCVLETYIPMRGVKSSLNVAVAFGIAAHTAATVLQSRTRERPAVGS